MKNITTTLVLYRYGKERIGSWWTSWNPSTLLQVTDRLKSETPILMIVKHRYQIVGLNLNNPIGTYMSVYEWETRSWPFVSSEIDLSWPYRITSYTKLTFQKSSTNSYEWPKHLLLGMTLSHMSGSAEFITLLNLFLTWSGLLSDLRIRDTYVEQHNIKSYCHIYNKQ